MQFCAKLIASFPLAIDRARFFGIIRVRRMEERSSQWKRMNCIEGWDWRNVERGLDGVLAGCPLVEDVGWLCDCSGFDGTEECCCGMGA